MQTSKLVRWGAPAAVLGGVLFFTFMVLGALVNMKILTGSFFEAHWAYHVIDVPINALLALGILGLYARQRESFGLLGKSGFYLGFLGFAITALGGLAIIGFELGVGRDSTPGALDALVHMIALLMMVAGSVLFGIDTLRAGLLPRTGALLLIAGPLALLAVGFGGAEGWIWVVPALLFGGGWSVLGYALLSRSGAVPGPAAPRPAAPRPAAPAS